MTRFICNLAISFDGFIAAPDGSVDWLSSYPAEDYGFAGFIAGIDTLVMGRVSFEQALGYGPWAYDDKRTIVLSSRPLTGEAPRGTEAWSRDLGELRSEITKTARKDVWIFGGGQTIRACLDAGLVDRFDLYVIPILLGQGLPLFPPRGKSMMLELRTAAALPRGVVHLVYDLTR